MAEIERPRAIITSYKKAKEALSNEGVEGMMEVILNEERLKKDWQLRVLTYELDDGYVLVKVLFALGKLKQKIE